MDHVIGASVLSTDLSSGLIASTLNGIVSNVPSLSVLNGALIANGLNETLADAAGTFTLFAPTNDAVSAFGGAVTVDVLTYHVLTTVYVSDDIPDGLTTLGTVNGATLNVTKNATGVFVQDQADRVGQVMMANIVGTNGVVHIIDIVLSPTA